MSDLCLSVGGRSSGAVTYFLPTLSCCCSLRLSVLCTRSCHHNMHIHTMTTANESQRFVESQQKRGYWSSLFSNQNMRAARDTPRSGFTVDQRRSRMQLHICAYWYQRYLRARTHGHRQMRSLYVCSRRWSMSVDTTTAVLY